MKLMKPTQQSWPTGLISQFLSDMGNESNLSSNIWSPAIDIKEEANQFVMLADLPGIDSKDLHITHNNGVLT